MPQLSLNADGLAWGTGTSIAHMAMDALMGPRVIKQETVASSASDVPPAPNTNGVGSSTVCADQFKALIDAHYFLNHCIAYFASKLMDHLACTGYSIEAELELELLEFEVDDQSDDVEDNSNQGASTSNSYKLIKESLAN
nr:hypothetical protein CFP56_41795 [Quercus suber]